MGTRDTDFIAIANAQHGVLGRRQILNLGYSRRQFDRRIVEGPWSRVAEGVYRHLAAPDTWESRLMAACLTGGNGTVASHRSAAALHRLTGGSTAFVEITSVRWRRSQHQDLIVHESKSITHLDVTKVAGVPTSTVERTLLDLGAVRGRVTVQMALDRALHSGSTTWERVDATLTRLAKSGRPGVEKLRLALRAREPGGGVPESERETQLLELLSAFGLPSPVAQHRVVDRHGVFLARVDAAYPQHRIAIEYDSDQEHSDPTALASDNARRNRLTAAGWTVISARNSDVNSDPGDLIQAITASLQDNPTRFGVNLPPPPVEL